MVSEEGAGGETGRFENCYRGGLGRRGGAEAGLGDLSGVARM